MRSMHVYNITNIGPIILQREIFDTEQFKIAFNLGYCIYIYHLAMSNLILVKETLVIINVIF